MDDRERDSLRAGDFQNGFFWPLFGLLLRQHNQKNT